MRGRQALGNLRWIRRYLIPAFVTAAYGLAFISPASAETTWERVQRTKTIKVGTDTSPPLSSVDDKGNLQGQSPTTLMHALAPLGVEKFEAVPMEFTSLIPALVAGRIDVIAASMAIRPARCAQIAFGNPDLSLVETIVVRKGNPKDLHSYKDVSAKKANFGLMRGGVQIQLADVAHIPADKILLFPDMPEAILAVASGRVDGTGIPSINAQSLLKTMNNDQVEMAKPFEQPTGADGKEWAGYTAIGFRPSDKDLRGAYNAQLKKMVESGELLRIIKDTGAGGESEMPPTKTADEICAGK